MRHIMIWQSSKDLTEALIQMDNSALSKSFRDREKQMKYGFIAIVLVNVVA